MKILFLQKSNKYSGAENVILQIMSLLPPDYETYYVSPDGPIKKIVEEKGLNFISLGIPNLKNVRKIVKKLNPDIVHASDYTMSVLASLASRKPVVSHLHSDPEWLGHPLNPKAMAYAICLPFINKVVTVSDSIKEEYAYSFLLKNKIITIDNVINSSEIYKKSLENPDDLKKVDLIYLGRLSQEKNPLLFCKIVNKVRMFYPHIRAVMIGNGNMKEQIKHYIAQNNLNENLQLLGFKKNPYPYIRGAQIGLMPSKYEGFGLAAVEMLSLGKPVLCSNAGGLKNIVNDKCGRICNDLSEYSEQIKKLLENKNYYNMKSRNALKCAEKYSNLNDYKDQIESIYNEIIKDL